MHLGVEWIKQPPFQSFMLALPPLTARKSSWLPCYCCCSLPLATSLSVSCERGCQEGAKAKQKGIATFLTCSRSSCETCLCVVKVLIRPVRENLRCNTATFLAQSIQQSFVSEKRDVKVTEHVVFLLGLLSHVVCALQPRGLIWSNQVGFSESSILWLNC